jgi:hypothetical protein
MTTAVTGGIGSVIARQLASGGETLRLSSGGDGWRSVLHQQTLYEPAAQGWSAALARHPTPGRCQAAVACRWFQAAVSS